MKGGSRSGAGRKEKIMTEIPDYPKFEEGKHQYVIAAAGSDGWYATYPVAEAIQRDIENAADDAFTDEEETEILATPQDEWVDSLLVFTKSDMYDEVAWFTMNHRTRIEQNVNNSLKRYHIDEILLTLIELFGIM